MINTWFGEYNDTTMEYINEFKERPDKWVVIIYEFW